MCGKMSKKITYLYCYYKLTNGNVAVNSNFNPPSHNLYIRPGGEF